MKKEFVLNSIKNMEKDLSKLKNLINSGNQEVEDEAWAEALTYLSAGFSSLAAKIRFDNVVMELEMDRDIDEAAETEPKHFLCRKCGWLTVIHGQGNKPLECDRDKTIMTEIDEEIFHELGPIPQAQRPIYYTKIKQEEED